MANSRIMLTCRHCGKQFVIGKGYFGNYRVPYCDVNFPKELDEFYEKHSMGECSGDANCADDAKEHYVILEQGDDFKSNMTNYERIKNMSVDEMAEYHTKLIYNHLNALIEKLGLQSYKPTEEDFNESKVEWKNLLKREVEE